MSAPRPLPARRRTASPTPSCPRTRSAPAFADQLRQRRSAAGRGSRSLELALARWCYTRHRGRVERKSRTNETLAKRSELAAGMCGIGGCGHEILKRLVDAAASRGRQSPNGVTTFIAEPYRELLHAFMLASVNAFRRPLHLGEHGLGSGDVAHGRLRLEAARLPARRARAPSSPRHATSAPSRPPRSALRPRPRGHPRRRGAERIRTAPLRCPAVRSARPAGSLAPARGRLRSAAGRASATRTRPARTSAGRQAPAPPCPPPLPPPHREPPDPSRTPTCRPAPRA